MDAMCMNCSYFVQMPDPSPDGDLVGLCRRYPRQFVGLLEEDPQWLFPLQFAKDSCGEHKEKEG